jgi:anti-sigma B factor antagonist
VTTSDLPAEGQPDVSTEGTEAPFDDVITLSTSTDEDGVVTVTVVGEVDTFTAPVLRSTLDSQLEQQPSELVIDLSGVQFLGSAGLAVLVETQKSSRARDVALRLIATTRAVTRPLEVTGLIDAARSPLGRRSRDAPVRGVGWRVPHRLSTFGSAVQQAAARVPAPREQAARHVRPPRIEGRGAPGPQSGRLTGRYPTRSAAERSHCP